MDPQNVNASSNGLNNTNNSSQPLAGIPLAGKSLRSIQDDQKSSSSNLAGEIDQASGDKLSDPTLPPLPNIGGVQSQGKTLAELQHEQSSNTTLSAQNNTQTINSSVEDTNQFSANSGVDNLPELGTTGPISGLKPTIEDTPPLSKESLPPVQPAGSGNFHPKREVVEKVVYKEKGGGFSIFGMFRSIKNCACSTLLLILLLFIGLIITIIFRPPVTWNPLKSFLNAGYTPPQVTEQQSNEIQSYINQVLTSTGSTQITLTENQVTNIVRDRFGGGDQRVDLEQDSMKLIVDLDSGTEKPLWLIVELKKDSEGQLNVTNIGVPRVKLPGSLNKFIGDFAFRSMSLAQGSFRDQSALKALSFLIKTDSNFEVSITGIEFGKDKIIITYQK